MYQDEIILCSASKYTQKYYLNEDFDNLPTEVKKSFGFCARCSQKMLVESLCLCLTVWET